uniref:C1q domain-containing protein n=1 Tax=Strigamia maritima TaxID=126957 RepID=T1INW2_STRMM
MGSNKYLFIYTTTILLAFKVHLTSSNGYGQGGNNGQYNPYNPYPYPCQCPYPPKPNPNPNPNPNPLSPTNVVAFAFTRGRKNNQCLNLHLCFLQFDNEVTKINAITYPSYGAFQAVTPGLYFFTFSLALGGSNTPRVSLRRNNDIIASVNGTTPPNGSSQHFPVTSSILLQLQPQDAVYIVIEDGDVIESSTMLQGPLNSFSGYLVAPIFPPNSTTNPPVGGGVGAPGSPAGFQSFPGGNTGFNGNNGNRNGFNLLNPSANAFPSNVNGMPPFRIGRDDVVSDSEYEAIEE